MNTAHKFRADQSAGGIVIWWFHFANALVNLGWLRLRAFASADNDRRKEFEVGSVNSVSGYSSEFMESCSWNNHGEHSVSVFVNSRSGDGRIVFVQNGRYIAHAIVDRLDHFNSHLAALALSNAISLAQISPDQTIGGFQWA